MIPPNNYWDHSIVKKVEGEGKPIPKRAMFP
jgi:hypothetical protein